MEPLRTQKTSSFGIRGQRQPHKPTHEVILINPFRSWKHRSYYKALEAWVQSAVDNVNRRQDTDVRLVWRRLRFSLSETLSEQGQRGLDAVIKKLRQQISGLVADPKSLIHQHRVKGQDEGTLLPLLFITHSIGFWVMEEALMSLDIQLPGFTTRPVGIVHLDGLEGGVPGADYLDRLSGTFNIPIWSPLDLIRRFEAVHTQFRQLARSVSDHQVSAGNSDPRNRSDVRVRVIRVWVSQEPMPRNDRHQVRDVVSRAFGNNTTKKLLYDPLAKVPLPEVLLSMAEAEVTHDVNQPPEGLQATTTGLPRASGDQDKEVQPTDATWAWKPPSRSRPSSPTSSRFMDPTQAHPKRTNFSNMIAIDSVDGAESDGSGGDDASAISIPRVPSRNGKPQEVELILALAQSFWRNGEFANSHALLERILNMMRDVDSQTGRILDFETRMRIGVLSLYRGRYDEAAKRLDDLSSALQRFPANQRGMATNELKRWAALSKIYRGNYLTAAEELKALLLSDGGHTQGQVSIVQIRRDLALVSGLLGRHDDAKRYMKACQDLQTLLQSHGTKEEGRLSRSKSWSIQYTEAYIDALCGKYDTALEKADAAFQGLRDHFGSAHLKTLRSATLGVNLLTRAGRYHEAEMQCRKTLQLTDHNLGRMHPLNLETLEGLVDILRSQSRFTEALETAKSLYAMTNEALSPDHPQALRARSQLAATHLAIGNYYTAEVALRDTVSRAQDHLGKNHPETLRFHAELAQALCYRGNLQEAMAIAIDTLKRQREVYTWIQPIKGRPAAANSSPDADLLGGGVVEKVLEEFREPQFQRHPSLVFTLQVIALIEAKDPGLEGRPGQNLHQAERILQFVVWSRRKDLGDLGSQHPLTLAAEYELAAVVRDSGPADARLDYVNRAFYHVWNKRCRLFGTSHPETLSAERDVVITDCVRGVWEEGGPARRLPTSDTHPLLHQPVSLVPLAETTESTAGVEPRLSTAQWVDVESVSGMIFVLHEAQLGPHHPETLKSLLWLFSVRLLLDKSRSIEIKQTWRQLRERLHHPSVLSERLVEALRTEERVALLFADQHDYLMGMGILHDIVDIVSDNLSSGTGTERDPPEHPLLSALSAIRADVEEEIHALLPHVNVHQDRLGTLDRLFTSPGKSPVPATSDAGTSPITLRREAYQLCKRLLGRRAEHTLRAYLALAQVRWDSGRETEQRKAFGAIGQLKARMDQWDSTGLLSKSFRQAVEDRSSEWGAFLSEVTKGKEGNSLIRYETAVSATSDEYMSVGE